MQQIQVTLKQTLCYLLPVDLIHCENLVRLFQIKYWFFPSRSNRGGILIVVRGKVGSYLCIFIWNFPPFLPLLTERIKETQVQETRV